MDCLPRLCHLAHPTHMSISLKFKEPQRGPLPSVSLSSSPPQHRSSDPTIHPAYPQASPLFRHSLQSHQVLLWWGATSPASRWCKETVGRDPRGSDLRASRRMRAFHPAQSDPGWRLPGMSLSQERAPVCPRMPHQGGLW